MTLSIKITTFKPSGKWYAESTVTMDLDHEVFIHDDEFIKIVCENATMIVNGYIVVTDLSGGDGFHNRLYTAEYLASKHYEITH